MKVSAGGGGGSNAISESNIELLTEVDNIGNTILSDIDNSGEGEKDLVNSTSFYRIRYIQQ